MKGPTPVQRFLGVPDGAESPFDLLGLTPDSCDGSAIEQALRARLERVSRHPEGASAEADEVRLALHAAAAQLADPRVRTLIASRWRRPRALPSRSANAAGAPGRAPALSRAETAFRSLALSLLARRSDARARRLLLALARSRGLSIAALLRPALRSAPPPPRPPVSFSRRPLAEQLKADLEDEGARLKRRFAAPLIVAASSLGVVLLLAGVLAWPLLRTPPVLEERPSEPLPERAPIAERTTTPAPPPAPPEPDMAPAEILTALRDLPARLRTDPGDAAWKYEQTIRAFARSWTAMDGPTLAACLEAMVEFVHRAPSGGETEARALGAISAGATTLETSGPALEPRALKPAIWSVGALSRLARERELPIRARDEVRAALVRLAPTALEENPAPFHAGAAAALRIVANVAPVRSEAPSSSEELWGSWLESVEAWRRSGEQLAGAPGAFSGPRDELLLAAVRRLLVLGPAPSTELPSQRLLERLLASLDWRIAAAPTRVRLFEWFDDPAVPTRDLATVTEWLAQESHAPGVTPAMILSRAASPEQRRDLRDRLRDALGEPGVKDEHAIAAPDSEAARAAIREWSAMARDRLSQKDSPGPLAPLERACALARLNAAAALIWRGEHEGATSLLRALTSPIAEARSSLPPPRRADSPVLTGGPGDGLWAREWISAPASVERRLEILASLESRSGELGPADADMLTEAALSAPQPEVRERARRIVRAHAGEAVVVNGLLEALPSAPRLEETADLIADVTATSLPAADVPSWPTEARAALVLRLMGMLLRESELGASDRIAAVLAAAHVVSSGGAADAAQSIEPEAGAARLWEHWFAELRRVEPASADGGADAVSQRRDARLALAQDPVRRFCANQLSAMEAMAGVASTERPSASPAIAEAAARAANERRSATSIAQQIESSERAMVELWRIRLGLTTEARP